MAKNFPNLGKETDTKIQETQREPKKKILIQRDPHQDTL